MPELLDRTHLESLVVHRLPSVTDRQPDAHPRWTARSTMTVVAVAAAIFGFFMSV